MQTATSTTADTLTQKTARPRKRPLARERLAGPRRLFSRLGVTARLRLLLFVLLVPLPAMGLYLLETRPGLAATQLVALWLAAGLVLLKPLSTLVARWVALGDIAAITAFCAALRRGDYARRLPLPPQGDDEHELLRLKRDLNWLAHHVETRETWLRALLEQTHQSKCRFEDLSRTDALTGLFNRRHFDALLPDLLEQGIARRSGLALLLVDCDAFKSVNDRFGHQAGDAVLAALGRAMRQSSRQGLDWAFRLGGDEFALISPNKDGRDALRLAERIRDRFAATTPHRATVSIGVACLDPDLDEPAGSAALFARADAALYRAKADGGNRTALDGAPSPSPN